MVEAEGGFTLCLPGELRAAARANLVELPFGPPIQAPLVALWRRHQEPDALGDLLAFLGDVGRLPA